MKKDPQITWDEYYAEIRNRRLSEAQVLWELIANAGISGETIIALDFIHFSSDKENAENLLTQLSENYEIELVQSDDPGYWFINGTTRPYGITLTKEDHRNWVEFMCDVARSHGCVFSTWSIENPKTKEQWRSELVET
jgi:hypothetical protein